MAIPINKFAKRCEMEAIANGKITTSSSPTALLYDISREWRLLCNATGFRSPTLDGWSEKEECAAGVIVAALAYLQRIGCKDIEQLLKRRLEQS